MAAGSDVPFGAPGSATVALGVDEEPDDVAAGFGLVVVGFGAAVEPSVVGGLDAGAGSPPPDAGPDVGVGVDVDVGVGV